MYNQRRSPREVTLSSKITLMSQRRLLYTFTLYIYTSNEGLMPDTCYAGNKSEQYCRNLTFLFLTISSAKSISSHIIV